ncbi:MAG: aminopeptidase P family protein [Theionarchaea archaeon]|nr:aminopeptidase P family protein [Theionarchaea archaeon]
MDYERQKVDRIQSLMRNRGIDFIVCRNSENVLYFSGYWPIRGWSFSVVPADGELVLLAPEYEGEFTERAWCPDVRSYEGEAYDEAAKLISELGVGGTVGFEGSFELIAGNVIGVENAHVGFQHLEFLKNSTDSAELVDVTDLLHEMRKVKTPTEIEAMRLAADLSGAGLEAAYQTVGDGIKETQVAAACESKIYEEGFGYRGKSQYARSFAFVMSGPQSMKAPRPYNICSPRKMKNGEAVLIELNTCVDGYWCDLTRTWVVGSPSEEQKTVWDLLVAGEDAAIDSIRDGIDGPAVDGAARKVINAGGFGEYFPAFLGHGIGVACHEPPFITPSSTDKLHENYTHTVEPGIAKESVGGLRVEDVVLDLKVGGQKISTFHREL